MMPQARTVPKPHTHTHNNNTVRHTKKAQPPMTTTYTTNIIRALSRLGSNGTTNPDAKSNTGSLLGTVYLWTEAKRYCEAKAKEALAALESSELIPPRDTLKAGEHQLCDSHSFACIAKVSEPVRRFNEDALVQALHKQYKVPEHAARELITACKLPTKSTVSLRVVEKA